MKIKYTNPVLSLLLASAFPFPGALSAQQQAQPPAQQTAPAQTANESATNTFAGKIARKSGKYVLIESASKSDFVLDDQHAAKGYNGRVVVITGTIDLHNKTIHVEKIEAAA